MASAAAVAADVARSPLNDTEVDEEHGITSKITAADDEHTGLTDDDEDEDIAAHSRVRKPQRPVADDGEEGEAREDADLFGDEDEEPAKSRRYLDDEELDSGDDEGREDRIEQDEPEMIVEERQVTNASFPRLPVPDPSDGEMYLMKVPKFLSIDARMFSEQSFQPPSVDHHAKEASKNFSAYNTATTTIRWRRSPSKPSELQSNARINRWSDGSLTLQFASNPTVQYELNGNALAPPQRNPLIPTPTSTHTARDRGGREGIDHPTEKFDPAKHAFTYLAAPITSRGLLRITNVLTTGLTVSPPADFIDDAIVNLQSNLAAAQNARTLNGVSSTIELVEITEDPELAKKRAEQAEREKARARKKQEAQVERERERSNRTLGRSGLTSSRYGGGGLSAGMLEDDDGLTTTRGRPAKTKAPRRRRANSEYSSEEDYGRNRFQVSKEDDYDQDDGFVAGSDEEEEIVDDDEDEDDGIIEEGRKRRDPTPKRSRDVEDDEDADGEVDDAPAAERKRRRVVLADDDDDE